jgi:hypothetical protein
MPKSLKDTVALLLENENAASLKPNSKSADPAKKVEGEVEDLGGPTKRSGDEKIDPAKNISKSKEPGPNPPVKAEPMKKLNEKETEESLEETEKDNTSGDEGTEDFVFEFDVSEDIKAMFNGSGLSEDFMNKAKVIYETTIKSNLQNYKKFLDEQFDKTLEESIEVIAEEMEEKVDGFLEYLGEEWMSENEVAVESTLRTELTEDFIVGLRNLFAESYIDIPEDKVDVVESMSTELEELKEKLNEEMIKNVNLVKESNELKKVTLINSVVDDIKESKNLTDVQSEKIRSLAESTDFTSEKEFKEKLSTLVESYFPSKTVIKDQSLIVENEVGDEPISESINPSMEKYVKALSKSLPK